MRRFNVFHHQSASIPNLNISFEQINVSSLTSNGFDEYDPEICTYILNHLTIANSLKECVLRAPKDFKIILNNNNEILFNKCLLSSVSETIFKLVQSNPEVESYKLESDDPTFFIQKLYNLLQGESVIFKKEERKPIRKIVGELMISNIPNWLKPKEITLLEPSNTSNKPSQSKIAIKKKSFVSFISNHSINFNSKFCYNTEVKNQYDFNQIFPDYNYSKSKSFEHQFDEYDDDNEFKNVRAPKADFEIRTQKNIYKCSIITALCSDVIYSKYQLDPTIRSFFYDFEDNDGSFKVVSDFLNGSIYELNSDNIDLSIKFATDLQIKPLLSELEKSISAYKLRVSNLKSYSDIMNNVCFLQNTLLSVTDENVDSSYESILNSIWCNDTSMVKELSSNIFLISTMSFKNLRPLSKVFKKLVSSDSISKKPSLSHLIHYFLKNFSFLDIYLDDYNEYRQKLDGGYIFESMHFLLMLKQEGVLKSSDIVSLWPTISDDFFVSKNHDNRREITSPYSQDVRLLPLVSLYFAPEVREVYKEHQMSKEAMSDCVRTLYEEKGTLVNSIFSDDIELFVSLTSKSSEVEFNFDDFVFVPFEFKITEIPLVDFAALCGSVKIFRYLAVDKKVAINFRTLFMAIKGRNEQILSFFTETFVNDNRKSLLQKLNEEYKKWVYFSRSYSLSNDRADNEIFYANLYINRSQYMNYIASMKGPQSFLLLSVQTHSHSYFEALCKLSTFSEIRCALIRSIEYNNFRAFSYIIEKVGIINVFKGIDVIGERCALSNNTDFLRVLFGLFEKDKLIGTSIENPPVLFLNGSIKSSCFYLPSALIAASQTGNVRLTELIIKTAQSLPKKKILPIITAGFNSAINRNFELFDFFVQKVGLILDDASVVTLLSYLFSHDDYTITPIVYNYYVKNGFTENKVILNYLAVGAAYLNDEKVAKELIQKVAKIDNTASFEEAFAGAAINGNVKLCNFIRKRPVSIENIDFVETVKQIIDKDGIKAIKVFMSLIVVDKRASVVKNGLLHAIRHRKSEFVEFFVENFLLNNQEEEDTNNENDENDNESSNDDENENRNENNENDNQANSNNNENESNNENNNENNNNNNDTNNENNNENNNDDDDDVDVDDLIVGIGMNVRVGAVSMIFVRAAFYGYLSVVKAMAALDSSSLFINSVVEDFGSALCAATSGSHEEIVDFLLTLPCIDPFVFNANYETPLIIAAKNRNYSLFTKILNFVSTQKQQQQQKPANNDDMKVTCDMKNKLKDQINLAFLNFISSFNFNKEYIRKLKLQSSNDDKYKKSRIAILPSMDIFCLCKFDYCFPCKKIDRTLVNKITFYMQVPNSYLRYFIPEYFVNTTNKTDDQKFIQFFTNCNLIDYGFNHYGCNFLIAAVRSKNYELVEFFLKKELTNVNFNDSNGMTAVMYAVINGSLDILKLLIENGSKSDQKNKKVDINQQNYFERTALSFAAYKNDFNIVHYIMNQPTFDAEKSNLLLSIETAIIIKKKRMAIYLLNYSNEKMDFLMSKNMKFYQKSFKTSNFGTSIKSYTSASHSILSIVVDYGDVEILDLLFKNKNFDITKFNQSKILYLSASTEKLDIFKYLLEHLQSSNKKDNKENLIDVNFEYKGKSLLFSSIFTNYLGITKYIINHPDFDPIKSKAFLALCKAIIERCASKVIIIGSIKGIDLNAQCPNLKRYKDDKEQVSAGIYNFRGNQAENAAGMTPLAIASSIDSFMMRILLDFPKIDVNSKCEDGSTPIFYCNTSYCIQLLYQQRDLDVNAQNNMGTTCLMNFISKRMGLFATSLVKKGANLLIKNKEGKNVLDLLGPDYKDLDVSKMDWREISRIILKALSVVNF